MGLLLLVAAYLATAGALGWIVRRWVPVSPLALVLVSLLPLTFTAGGFLPGKTLASTVSLSGVAPWANPTLNAAFEAGSSPENLQLFDSLSQFEPWRRAARRDLLFNPAQGGGAALLANGQSAVLFPLELVARILPPPRATTYVQAAKLLLGAWGMFLLVRFLAPPDGISAAEVRGGGRRLDSGELGALVGATLFVGSGFLELWRTSPIATVAALVPWLVWAQIRLIREPGPGRAAILGCLGALGVTAGHPETLLHGLLLALLLSVPFWRRSSSPRTMAWGAAAAVLAVLLSAPVLLPFLENLQVSAEWSRRQAVPPIHEVSLPETAHRLVPAVCMAALGDFLRGTWSGVEGPTEMGGGALGFGALLLLPLGVVAEERRRLLLWWTTVGLFGLLVAAGAPLLSGAVGSLPLLGTTLTKRLSLWWVVVACAGAGVGVEAAAAARRRRWGTVAGGLFILGLGIAWAVAPTPADRLRSVALVLAGAVLTIGGVVLLGSVRFGLRRLAPGVLVAGVLLPQVLLLGRWVPVSTSISFYPETEAVRWVRERARGWRVSGRDAALFPHSASFFGFEEVRAYDPMTFEPYREFSRALGELPEAGWSRILDLSSSTLDFLGVRYLFDHPYMGERTGVERVYSGYDAVVYENPGARPRLFFPSEVEVFERHDESLQAVLEGRDLVVWAGLSGPGLPAPGTYPNPGGRVLDLRIDPRGGIEARVVSEGLSALISSQPAIPGWQLFVDGEPETPIRVDGAFLGALIPAGRHRVELRYAPESWNRGLILGFLGLGLLAWTTHRASVGGRVAPPGEQNGRGELI